MPPGLQPRKASPNSLSDSENPKRPAVGPARDVREASGSIREEGCSNLRMRPQCSRASHRGRIAESSAESTAARKAPRLQSAKPKAQKAARKAPRLQSAKPKARKAARKAPRLQSAEPKARKAARKAWQRGKQRGKRGKRAKARQRGSAEHSAVTHPILHSYEGGNNSTQRKNATRNAI